MVSTVEDNADLEAVYLAAFEKEAAVMEVLMERVDSPIELDPDLVITIS